MKKAQKQYKSENTKKIKKSKKMTTIKNKFNTFSHLICSGSRANRVTSKKNTTILTFLIEKASASQVKKKRENKSINTFEFLKREGQFH